IQPSPTAHPEPAAHHSIPRSRPEGGVSCARLALPRREILGLRCRPCHLPSARNPGRYGCVDRTSGSIGSVAAPKATGPARQSSHQHRSSGASRRKPLQAVFVMESAQYWCGHDLMTDRKAVSAGFDSHVAQPWVGNARSSEECGLVAAHNSVCSENIGVLRRPFYGGRHAYDPVCGELLILGKSVIRHTHGAGIVPTLRNPASFNHVRYSRIVKTSAPGVARISMLSPNSIGITGPVRSLFGMKSAIRS